MRLLAILLAACLLLPPDAQAAEPAEAGRAATLVKQLGDNSFAVREQAAAGLRELGLASEKALRQGLGSADPEIRSTCEALLTALLRQQREARLKGFLEDMNGTQDHGLVGWQRFAKLTGRDSAARKLFVQMYRADATLLETAEQYPKDALAQVESRAGTLAHVLIMPKADEAAFTEAVTLLFVATDPQVKLSPKTYAGLGRGIEVLANRKTLRQRWVESVACRQILFAFVRRPDDETSRNLGLELATAFELSEARDWAVTLATDRQLPATTRGLALLLLGRIGDKGLVAKLEPLLADTTSVGTKTLGSVKLVTELRDVALAALVQMTGGKPEEYGFPYLEAVPGLKSLPDPVCLGFPGPDVRDAALKHWQQRRPSE